MPVLNWIGKDAVVTHHKDVPYRLLEPVPELSCPPLPLAGEGRGEGASADSGNLIVQGDNLLALKALLPRYAGQVKCIYIDPPYNTGNEGWTYNDNVNSPEIRRWLGDVVKKEGETLDRHDRWLCMMYPRLVVLRQFLSDDGAIFVSIDDNEAANLRLLMDEIFGASNFLSDVIWQHSVQGKNDSKEFSLHHNHTLVYQRSDRFVLGRVPRTEENNANYSNPDNDPKGDWRAGDVRSPNLRENLRYRVKTPGGKIIDPPEKGWRWAEDVFWEKFASGEISFVSGETRVLRKIYLSEQGGRVPETIWFGIDVGTTREASAELKEIFGSSPFDTPKPSRLIQRILQIATDKNSLVLDSYAGSGTTAHAVLKQNSEDGGNRRFILVEMDEDIAQNVTAERVKRVARGYTNAKDDQVKALGGSFQFCKLSKEPLFTADGQIREDVKFAQLAEFVWFSETGAGMPSPQPSIARERGGKHASPLLGVHNGRAIYLLYNGILGDKSVDGGNVLTGPVLDILPKHDGPRVIYAAACRLGAPRLNREGIVFKQTPYALDVSP